MVDVGECMIVSLGLIDILIDIIWCVAPEEKFWQGVLGQYVGGAGGWLVFRLYQGFAPVLHLAEIGSSAAEAHWVILRRGASERGAPDPPCHSKAG